MQVKDTESQSKVNLNCTKTFENYPKHKMNYKTAIAIVDAAESLGLDITIRPNYSGRGMYGKETTGIIYDHLGDLMASVAQTAVNLKEIQNAEDFDYFDEFMDDLNLRMDNMGYSSIAY